MKCTIFVHLGFVVGLLVAPIVTPAVNAAVESNGVVVGYYSQASQTSFEEKIKPLFAEQTKGCKQCQITNLTPYDGKGIFDLEGFEKSLKQIPAEIKILFFDFNLKKAQVPQNVIEQINQLPTKGILIVASAGVPAEQESSSPLSRTLFGQIKEAIIIGELGDRDRLMPQQAFFGPEMLTAIRPPKEYRGQGVGPLFFASKLAVDYNRRSPQEWTGYIKDKKQKSRKLWLELQDFFK